MFLGFTLGAFPPRYGYFHHHWLESRNLGFACLPVGTFGHTNQIHSQPILFWVKVNGDTPSILNFGPSASRDYDHMGQV